MKHISLITAACAVLSSATGFCQDPGVPEVNPSFETPAEPAGSTTYYQTGAGTSTALTGWTTVSTGGVFEILNDQNNPSNALVSQNGNQYLEDQADPDLGYSGAGTVSQLLTTSFVAGEDYDLIFRCGGQGGYPAQQGDYVFIANSSGRVLTAANLNGAPTDGSMAQVMLLFKSTGTAGDTGPIEIGFAGVAQSVRSTMAVDNLIFYIDVPEPSSMAVALIGGGVCCILVARARGNRHFRHGLANMIFPASRVNMARC
jgi:hypothetical protein